MVNIKIGRMIKNKDNIIDQIPDKVSYRVWCNSLKILDFIDAGD